MRRDTRVTSYDAPETAVSHVPHDDPQRILIVAYTRLSLLCERADGSKLTVIASYGSYDIRLVQLTTRQCRSICPLWIELYDRSIGRVLDSAGCQVLNEAGVALEALVADTNRRNEIALADRPCS